MRVTRLSFTQYGECTHHESAGQKTETFLKASSQVLVSQRHNVLLHAMQRASFRTLSGMMDRARVPGASVSIEVDLYKTANVLHPLRL